jgi:hypothetical protein
LNTESKSQVEAFLPLPSKPYFKLQNFKMKKQQRNEQRTKEKLIIKGA